MKRIGTAGSPDAPLYTVALSTIGTPRYSPVIPIQTQNNEAPMAVIVRGRVESVAGGGSIVMRAVMNYDGAAQAADVTGQLELGGRAAQSGADGPSPTIFAVVGVANSAVGATYYNQTATNQTGGVVPIPCKAVQFRVSNPGAAYSGGNLIIESVEVYG